MWKRHVFSLITLGLLVMAPTGSPSLTAGFVSASAGWQPALSTNWQWQLTTPVDLSVNAEMWIIDLFDNGVNVISALHAQGGRAVCAVNAGAWENWRPDAGQFPNSVKGNSNGWSGERYLDIRRMDVLGPLMQARMDLCVQKGFDGIEFDNVDGYTNDTGFPLTYQDQIAYNTFLAKAAHVRGLSVGLQNDIEQIPDLLPYVDWGLNEQCFEYSECAALLPFIQAGKAVFNVEYNLSTSSFCPQANAMNFNSMRKGLGLGSGRVQCRSDGVPTPTNTPAATSTSVPSNTSTPVPTVSNTPVPPSNTSTPVPTATSTPVPSNTPTRTPTVSNTPVPPPNTATPVPAATSTPVPSNTPTRTPTVSNTPVPPPNTSTPVPAVTNTSSPIWKPPLRTTWQWQLTGTVDLTVAAQMWDIDLFDNLPSVVTTIHALGGKAVCYMSAGTWEDWRPDASQFPASVKGSNNGWPGELWLDIRQINALGPIMQARLDLCQSKGFDGVEFDNVDGYANSTGFPLTYQDQITYNTFLANAAHAHGLAAALKNDLGQVPDLLPYFEFAINEQCFQYSECDTLLPFIQAGKPVFQVEYSLSTSSFCPQANAMNFDSMRKRLALDAWRETCW